MRCELGDLSQCLRCYNHAEVLTKLAYFNQHSFTITAFLGVTLLGFLALSDGLQLRELLALGALIIGLMIPLSLLRTGESSIDEANEVLKLVGSKPILLEFYSNY